MKSIKANLSESKNESTSKFFNAAKFIRAAVQTNKIIDKKSSDGNEYDKNNDVVAIKTDVSSVSNDSNNNKAKRVINFGFGYYEGDVVDGRMEGYGTFYYDNHDKYEGTIFDPFNILLSKKWN